MLKKMRKKAGALLVMICLGVIILLCWEAGEHLKDKILRSLETAAEAMLVTCMAKAMFS